MHNDRDYWEAHAQTHKKLLTGGSVLFLIFLVVSTIVLVVTTGKENIVSPLWANAQNIPKPTKLVVRKKKNPQDLQKRIQEALDDSVPSYSIIVEDLLSPFSLSMGEQSSYVGASIHKIPILLALYYRIQEGSLSESTKITFHEQDRQDYGTGQMRYERAGKEYTIAQIAELMMKKSDNTAAHILANNVLDLKEIQEIITTWGLKETNMNENTTTNADIAMLLRRLFTGRLLNAQMTRKTTDLMLKSDFEDRIPALLPSQTRVYHKIGTTIAGLHDVGVVISPHSMYYIGIFTKSVSQEERATRAIARVSREVFDFMEQE